MFEEEIQQLQVMLYRIVTLRVNSPDKREYQQQAYEYSAIDWLRFEGRRDEV
jgi:hypothetical protein